MARLAVLASGNGSNFQALAEALRGLRSASAPGGHECVLLIHDRKAAFAAQRAALLGVPAPPYQLFRARSRRGGSRDRRGPGRGAAPISSPWPASCASSRPSSSRRGMAASSNVHPSLLPKWPGSRAIERAFEAGERGVRRHGALRRRGHGHGPIIASAVLRGRAAAASLSDIEAKVHAIEHEIYPRAVLGLLDAIDEAKGKDVKILIAGSGAREHALAWAVSRTGETASTARPATPAPKAFASNVPRRSRGPGGGLAAVRGTGDRPRRRGPGGPSRRGPRRRPRGGGRAGLRPAEEGGRARVQQVLRPLLLRAMGRALRSHGALLRRGRPAPLHRREPREADRPQEERARGGQGRAGVGRSSRSSWPSARRCSPRTSSWPRSTSSAASSRSSRSATAATILVLPACADHKKAGVGDTGPQYRRDGRCLPRALRGRWRDGEDRARDRRADLPGHGGRGPLVSGRALLRDHADRRRPQAPRIQRALRRPRDPVPPAPPRDERERACSTASRRGRSARCAPGFPAETACGVVIAAPGYPGSYPQRHSRRPERCGPASGGGAQDPFVPCLHFRWRRRSPADGGRSMLYRGRSRRRLGRPHETRPIPSQPRADSKAPGSGPISARRFSGYKAQARCVALYPNDEAKAIALAENHLNKASALFAKDSSSLPLKMPGASRRSRRRRVSRPRLGLRELGREVGSDDGTRP